MSFLRLALALLLMLPLATNAQTLNLQQYIEEVEKNSPSYSRAKLNAAAAKLNSRQMDFEFAPRLFSNVQYAHDRKQKQNPAVSGETAQHTSLVVGVKKKMRSGTEASLSYNKNYYDVYKAGRAFVPMPQYYDNYWQFEISQSLWQNAWGRQSKLKENAHIATAEAQVYSAEFALKQLLTSAELSYYNLASMRQITKAQEEGVKRARAIYRYNQKRAQRFLIDEADVLRSKAAYQLRQLELKQAQDQLENAALNFNSLQGIDSSSVNQKLNLPTVKEVLALKLGAKTPTRLDTKASMMQRTAALNQSQAHQELFKPELEVYGQLRTGGMNKDAIEAIKDSHNAEHVSSVVGLRFVYPFGKAVINDLSQSLSKQAEASRYQYKQAQLEEKVLWSNLKNQLTAAQAQLKLALALEKAQHSKLVNEKKERNRGRSTTFQVLLAEQDYISAQINTLQLINRALSVYAQINLFGENK